jgi:hypothetical protein
VKITHLIVFRERHTNGKFHFHFIIRVVDRTSMWADFQTWLGEKQQVHVHMEQPTGLSKHHLRGMLHYLMVPTIAKLEVDRDPYLLPNAECMGAATEEQLFDFQEMLGALDVQAGTARKRLRNGKADASEVTRYLHENKAIGSANSLLIHLTNATQCSKVCTKSARCLKWFNEEKPIGERNMRIADIIRQLWCYTKCHLVRYFGPKLSFGTHHKFRPVLATKYLSQNHSSWQLSSPGEMGAQMTFDATPQRQRQVLETAGEREVPPSQYLVNSLVHPCVCKSLKKSCGKVAPDAHDVSTLVEDWEVMTSLYPKEHFCGMWQLYEKWLMGEISSVKRGSTVFVHGKAGTGKSTVFMVLRQLIPDHRAAVITPGKWWCEEVFEKFDDNVLLLHNSEWEWVKEQNAPEWLKLAEGQRCSLNPKGAAGSHQYRNQDALKLYCGNLHRGPWTPEHMDAALDRCVQVRMNKNLADELANRPEVDLKDAALIIEKAEHCAYCRSIIVGKNCPRVKAEFENGERDGHLPTGVKWASRFQPKKSSSLLKNLTAEQKMELMAELEMSKVGADDEHEEPPPEAS